MVQVALQELKVSHNLSYSGVGRHLLIESCQTEHGQTCDTFKMIITNTDDDGAADFVKSDNTHGDQEDLFLHKENSTDTTQSVPFNTSLSSNNHCLIKSPEHGSQKGVTRSTPSSSNVIEPCTPTSANRDTKERLHFTRTKRKRSTPDTVGIRRSTKSKFASPIITSSKSQTVTPTTKSMKRDKTAFELFVEPLTGEEESLYLEAFRDLDLNGQLCAYGDIKILGQDLKTLSPQAWLNDTIIDLFFGLLDHQENFLVNDPERPKCLFMRTAFMYFLTSGGYSYTRVQGWTKDVDIFEFDKIFIPINVGRCHWLCMAVFMEDKIIEVFDSMKGTYLNELVIVF